MTRVCSSFIYNDPPRYHHGHGTNIGCLCLGYAVSLLINLGADFVAFCSAVLCCFAMWNYDRLNKKKETGDVDEGKREDYKQMGDESPLFR